MHALVDTQTPFHIDFAWWESRGRDLGLFLAEMLGEEDYSPSDDGPIDYIDPHTAEVHRVDPIWARVLIERAHRPDYITPSTPMTNAVLRALVENLNEPMSAVDLQRRINRANPQTVLRVLRTARLQYGIVPVLAEDEASSASRAPRRKKAEA